MAGELGDEHTSLDFELSLIREMRQNAIDAVSKAATSEALSQVETAYLGKKGAIKGMLKTIGRLSPEYRPAFGASVNVAADDVLEVLEARRSELRKHELTAQLAQESIDISMPGDPLMSGGLHPLTQTSDNIKRVLAGMGFEFVDGPELEEYAYNFAALNYPEEHPAMDDQNSFFVTDSRLLRTQTTALQGRIMADRRPPFRIATIGRCFRYEAIDATHHHTFHQVDVFMVDQKISMADLKGTLASFARQMFGEETLVRFRPDFFPFVEPGVDYSIRWQGRWLELGGAGMIHPNILQAHGINSDKYSGFAFGLGIERAHMIQTGVNDLRLYLENDIRFLRQF